MGMGGVYREIVPPERVITPELATAVTVPPQGLTAGVTLGMAATLIPAGRLSVKATPVSATVFAFGLVMVNVKVELPPCVVFGGLNALAITGGATTVRVAVLLTVPGLGVCVVLTPEVVFGLSPALLLVRQGSKKAAWDPMLVTSMVMVARSCGW